MIYQALVLLKQDTIQDLAFLTGATVINEELGDDMDLIILLIALGSKKAVTNDKNTVITTIDLGEDLSDRIENVRKAIKKEKKRVYKEKNQDRWLCCQVKVGMVK